MIITPLPANQFLTDGGAMFGLVPKVLWQKRCPADEKNAIVQRANSFLVRDNAGVLGLVDCGCGDPSLFPERERALHGLEEEWLLRKSLHKQGVEFEDIAWVLLSHAHWDHAGGLLRADESPTFPNARVLLRETERDLVLGGDPLLYKSYPPRVKLALEILADQTEVFPGNGEEVRPGIRVFSGAGHTEGQACILFEAPEIDGAPAPFPAAVFAGDNLPTRQHLRMVFQTAYDTYPLKTRAWKREWLPRIAREGMALLFTHDPDAYGATIREDAREEFCVETLLTGVLS